MEEFTDYHTYSWYVALKPPGILPYTLKLTPLLILAIIAAYFIGVYLDSLQSQIIKGEITLVLTLYSTIAILILHTIIYYILKARGPKITNFTINYKGIIVSRKQIPWQEIDKSSLKKSLDSNHPPSSKRHHLITLDFTKQNGKKISLLFEHSGEFTKAKKAITHYLFTATH